MKLRDTTVEQRKSALLGKTVRWESQAHGSATVKTGVVVYAGPLCASNSSEVDRPDRSIRGRWLSPEAREDWVRADPRARDHGGPRRQHLSCSGIIVRVEGKTYPNFYAPSGSTELEIVPAEEGAVSGKL